MASAVRRLGMAPELVLVDGHETVGDIAHEQRAVVGGDGKCLSIAAASIVAKVIRDRLMERLDKVWPGVRVREAQGIRDARAPRTRCACTVPAAPPLELRAGHRAGVAVRVSIRRARTRPGVAC
jgi:ribonuclease HII